MVGELSTVEIEASRRWLCWLRDVLTAAVLLAVVLAVLGQLVRDAPSAPWWLFYLPLAPIGLWALLQDLAVGGRSLHWPRFALALIGLAVLAWAGCLMGAVGGGRSEGTAPRVVSLLQWNIHWGGGREAGPESWEQIAAELERRSADIVVLSEAPAPERGWLEGLARRQGWSIARCSNDPGSNYWYHLVVCAPGEVTHEYDAAVPNGHIMSVLVRVGGQPLRILVVDGESEPRRSRLPLLADVAERCRHAQEKGTPIDVLAGDFNTPGRSRGFDDFATVAGGYRLASWSAIGWRGTYPATCPLYDIDHIWLHRRLALRDSELFTNLASDHRGQMVRFYLADKE